LVEENRVDVDEVVGYGTDETREDVGGAVCDEFAVGRNVVFADGDGEGGDVDGDVEETKEHECELGGDRLEDGTEVRVLEVVERDPLEWTVVDVADFEDPSRSAKLVDAESRCEGDSVEKDRNREEVDGEDERVGVAGGDEAEDEGEDEGNGLRGRRSALPKSGQERNEVRTQSASVSLSK
jgi:hypothetical protein